MKPNQSDLETKLKRDAAKLSPTFDERLHERVVSSLDRASVSDEFVVPASRSIFRMFPISIAAMVLVGLGVWWGVGRGGGSNNDSPPPVAKVSPSIPLPGDLFAERATQIQQKIRETMTDEPLAALNQDTLAFTSFVAQQLDVVPTRGERER